MNTEETILKLLEQGHFVRFRRHNIGNEQYRLLLDVSGGGKSSNQETDCTAEGVGEALADVAAQLLPSED